MSELKYESLIPQEYSKIKNSCDNQTVIFELNNYNAGYFAYSGEFLFKRTVQKMHLQYTNITDNEKDPNKDPDMTTCTEVFRYYEKVKDMCFKFGLKRELYKNSHGLWVDITAIRKNMGLFLQMITGVIDESLERGEFKTSVYTKVADYIFNHLEEDSVLNQYLVSEKDIPRVTFVDSNGKYWEIGPGDGTIITSEPEKYQFKKFLESENIDNVHLKDDKYILFTEELADSETGVSASTSYENNDTHKFDDLKLTFVHSDKTTAFTDTDNLMIFVNGLVVDYIKHPDAKNMIYLRNVKRLANIQQVGLKRGYGPDGNFSYVKNGDNKYLYWNFDNLKCKFSYKFDIRIFKWENVKLSHFTLPINQESILKTEANSSNTYWLPYKLMFSDKVNKDKTILICSGEIVPKNEWDIDPNDNHVVRLLYTNFEFNQLMNEMTAKMRVYLTHIIEHDIMNEPKLSDYVTDYSSTETINRGFDNYVSAMNEYIGSVTGGLYDHHFALSAINSVIKQFDNRTYSIVTVDKLDENKVYEYKFYENREDIILDKPRINQLTNRNWSNDDIIIINGMSRNLVNVYDNKFKFPTTNWLPYQDNILHNADAYKFQILELRK